MRYAHMPVPRMYVKLLIVPSAAIGYPFSIGYLKQGDTGYVTRVDYAKRLVAVRWARTCIECWMRAEDVRCVGLRWLS